MKRVNVVLIQRIPANSSVLLTGMRSEVTFPSRYVMPRFAALLCKTSAVTGSLPTARAAHLKGTRVRIRKTAVNDRF